MVGTSSSRGLCSGPVRPPWTHPCLPGRAPAHATPLPLLAPLRVAACHCSPHCPAPAATARRRCAFSLQVAPDLPAGCLQLPRLAAADHGHDHGSTMCVVLCGVHAQPPPN